MKNTKSQLKALLKITNEKNGCIINYHNKQGVRSYARCAIINNYYPELYGGRSEDTKFLNKLENLTKNHTSERHILNLHNGYVKEYNKILKELINNAVNTKELPRFFSNTIIYEICDRVFINGILLYDMMQAIPQSTIDVYKLVNNNDCPMYVTVFNSEYGLGYLAPLDIEKTYMNTLHFINLNVKQKIESMK